MARLTWIDRVLLLVLSGVAGYGALLVLSVVVVINLIGPIDGPGCAVLEHNPPECEVRAANYWLAIASGAEVLAVLAIALTSLAAAISGLKQVARITWHSFLLALTIPLIGLAMLLVIGLLDSAFA